MPKDPETESGQTRTVRIVSVTVTAGSVQRQFSIDGAGQTARMSFALVDAADTLTFTIPTGPANIDPATGGDQRRTDFRFMELKIILAETQ